MWFWKSQPPDERSQVPAAAPSGPQSAAESACPVDHRTREAWLKRSEHRQLPPSHPQLPSHDILAPLGEDREISSIPRAFDTAVASPYPSPTSPPSAVTPSHSSPSNSEHDTGHDRASGNWVYPSERQFFDAMARKSLSPDRRDMRSVVPIHNAVNERAWALIRAWEEPYAHESKRCGGPRLLSFKGLGAPPALAAEGNAQSGWADWAQAMLGMEVSPRAKWKVLMGYKAPFDRHDWVVDRCGKRVEYVIDFYEGRDANKGMGMLNFYLDVRPKLNSWEGWRMRFWRTFV